MIEHIGVVMLAVFYPSGRAGGYHREHAAVLDSAEELVCLFDNREVCAEVGVKDLVEAETSECRDHLALNIGADVHSEALAESDADRRRGVNNDELLGIVDSLENLCGVVLLIYSAGRAVDNALAAGDARHGIERSLERRTDVGVKSAGICADNGDVLSLTCCDAAAAEDAFFHVAHHRRREVHHRLGGFSLVLGLADAEVFGHGLQAAIAVLRAGEAFVGVVREDQLQNGLPGVDDAGCVGADDHPFRADGFAGRSQVFASFDLYDADAADTGVVLAAQLVQVEVAERRNFDADRSGRFDQVGARGDLCGSVVDG